MWASPILLGQIIIAVGYWLPRAAQTRHRLKSGALLLIPATQAH
jgi:hypothetical protein